jgi:hypothetical protein
VEDDDGGDGEAAQPVEAGLMADAIAVGQPGERGPVSRQRARHVLDDASARDAVPSMRRPPAIRVFDAIRVSRGGFPGLKHSDPAKHSDGQTAGQITVVPS